MKSKTNYDKPLIRPYHTIIYANFSEYLEPLRCIIILTIIDTTFVTVYLIMFF